MERIGCKIQRQGVLMILLSFVLMYTGCEEQFDNPVLYPSDGEMVEVELHIGLADESDASTYPAATTTKVAENSTDWDALDVRLVPDVRTKTLITDHPDKLYNLEIYQYSSNETYLACTTTQTIDFGTSLNVSLNSNTSKQLIIARGQIAAIGAFGSKSLSEVRKLTANATIINAIGVENGANINNMPYLLYLPEVKIENGKIVSPDGIDVRLLLKRLTVGLTLDWTISQDMINKGYDLIEVRLMQVPKDYFILPTTEYEAPYGEMYPTSISEFVDGFRLKRNDLSSTGNNIRSQTLWLPANARGTRNDINSPNQRSKERAHDAATYVEFVVDNAGKKERLYYRVYLGGNTTSDFNLKENTNYHWKVNINNANYTTDSRIQLLDQTPVESNNFIETSNSFMMRPGMNICFNPYKHEAGTDGWNTYLTANGTSIDSDKVIDHVKVLWQTKDNGTSGNLVMGYVINENQHENLVNLTGTGIEGTRVHVKVPQSKGGNAVIAAYNSSNVIVWSWHIWITDYVPVRINDYNEYESAQRNTENGTVHKYDSPLFGQGRAYANMVLMDRDLGARTGGYPAITTGKGNAFSTMDAVNTYGLLYQWGRKDPFFNSLDGTNKEKDVIYDGYGIAVNMETSTATTQTYSIQHPLTYLTKGDMDWCTTGTEGRWNAQGASNFAPGIKALHDPCPKGWKVWMIFDKAPDNTSLTGITIDDVQEHSVLTNFAKTSTGDIKINKQSEYDNNFTKFPYFYNGDLTGLPGKNAQDSRFGRVFFIGNTMQATMNINNTVWIPATAERNSSGVFNFAGQYGHMWGADTGPKGGIFVGYRNYDVETYEYNRRMGWPVRCIQDNKMK